MWLRKSLPTLQQPTTRCGMPGPSKLRRLLPRVDDVEVDVVGAQTMLAVCSLLENNTTRDYIPVPSAKYKCDEIPSVLAIVLGIVLGIVLSTTHFPSISSPLLPYPSFRK